MSSGLDELTVHAHQLVSAGDLHGARRVLADALADADPRPANASPELADAAGLQARVLVALGDPQAARAWAAYAYAATGRLYGRSDPQTVAAAATLAAVLHRVGSDARAAHLYSEVIIELTATDGPESLRVLAAHADLATVEYARGQCGVARDRLQDAWELHREVYGDGHPSGIKMLARLGAMQRDCGRYADSHRNLTYADELCRRYLTPGDPLAAQVAALSRAAAKSDHVCADDEPDEPTPAAAAAPGPPEPPYDPEPPYSPGGVADPEPAYPPSSSPGGPADPEPAYPPSSSRDAEPEDLPPTSWDPATHWDPPTHWGQAEHPSGPAYPEPETDASPAPPHPVPPPRLPLDDDPGGWPPEEAGGWPPEEADRTATGAVPPAVVPRAGTSLTAPGVHRVRRDTEPDAPSRLLPVPVHRPPPPPRPNRLVPVIAAGVVVALLGAAAVIAGVARVGGSRDDAPPVGGPSPGASGEATPRPSEPVATPGTPPGSVRLDDNRDAIVLRWTYPNGAEGPVVVSGGRSGQDPRAFTELPAGTTTYTVHNLDRGTDFCFTVAVVWSTDSVGRSRPICTNRR
ncbi:tetratricopeptide repeat protein [Micromonospora fluostatini]|uniref:tetratricopeptide repeat protein n=1 Tax=Micromonospora sp. JCM 30529 TaxID=3421643 RepID=UPI003D174E00